METTHCQEQQLLREQILELESEVQFSALRAQEAEAAMLASARERDLNKQELNRLVRLCAQNMIHKEIAVCMAEGLFEVQNGHVIKELAFFFFGVCVSVWCVFSKVGLLWM